MSQNNTADNELPTLALTPMPQTRAVEIPNALPVHLQTLDVARHTVIAPNDKRYVVATFNDSILGREYITAIYPQENGYLTLVRLTIREFVSNTIDQAIQRHTSVVQTIQQGKLNELPESSPK